LRGISLGNTGAAKAMLTTEYPMQRSYDNNGNLLTLTGAATSTYTWDYRNRMISAWVSGATPDAPKRWLPFFAAGIRVGAARTGRQRKYAQMKLR
jgi:hypothetical protein